MILFSFAIVYDILYSGCKTGVSKLYPEGSKDLLQNCHLILEVLASVGID